MRLPEFILEYAFAYMNLFKQVREWSGKLEIQKMPYCLKTVSVQRHNAVIFGSYFDSLCPYKYTVYIQWSVSSAKG